MFFKKQFCFTAAISWNLGWMPLARSTWDLHKLEMNFISVCTSFAFFPFNFKIHWLKNCIPNMTSSWGFVCLLIGRIKHLPTSSLAVGTKLDGYKAENQKFQYQFISGSNVCFSKPLSKWQQILFPLKITVSCHKDFRNTVSVNSCIFAFQNSFTWERKNCNAYLKYLMTWLLYQWKQ